jgi:hypothetical protein
MFDYQFVVNPAYNRDRGPVSLYLRTSEKNSDLLHKCYSFDSDTYSLSGHRADLRMVARAGVAAKFTFLVHSHRSKSTTLSRGMTFGGMGSKKLIGENIEYIANYDSHPGAQFNSEFRSLVKSEIAKLTADDTVATAQAAASRPNKVAQLPQPPNLKPAEERLTDQQRGLAAKDIQVAQTEMPKRPKRTKPEHVTEDAPNLPQRQLTAFLDSLSSSVNARNLFDQRRLTTAV